MADGITVTVTGDKELIAKFGKMSNSVRERLRGRISRLQWILRRLIQDELHTVLHTRTSALSGGITVYPIEEDSHGIRGPVGTGDTVYARIHEYGGTVVPKTAGALTIPLEAALTPQGVAKGTAREVGAEYDGTFFKHGVLFGKTGKEIIPLFALVQSVTIPARPYMKPALLKVKPQVEAELREMLVEIFKG